MYNSICTTKHHSSKSFSIIIWEWAEVSRVVLWIIWGRGYFNWASRSFLNEFNPGVVSDRWEWGLESLKLFYVRSIYRTFLKDRHRLGFEPKLRNLLDLIWKLLAPSKTCIFCWRMLLARLPMRDALLHRGVVPVTHERCCPLCFEQDETIWHLFLSCMFTTQVWRGIYSWLGFSKCNSLDSLAQFQHFGSLIQNTCTKKVTYVIWLVSLWCI